MATTLPDDLVELFLRRLPPEDPASLVRASLVCKEWRRILADRGFCRRLCDHEHRHPRLPAMLGFFGRGYGPTNPEANPLLFTPTSSSFRPRIAGGASLGHRYVVDARHGRVLLAGTADDFLQKEPSTCRFAVWDPITGDLLELPSLTRRRTAQFTWKAVVLCASIPNPSGGATSSCDHLDCHRRPFLVVFVGTSEEEVYAYVYSSQAGQWSHSASAVREAADRSTLLCQNGLCSSTVAGNAAYFRLLNSISVLKYDLSTQEISSFDLPAECRSGRQIILTTTKFGQLAVAVVDDPWMLLWTWDAGPDGLFRWIPARDIGFRSRETGPDPDGHSRWARARVIDLSTVRQANPYPFYVVDIVHTLYAVIIWAHDGVFSVEIGYNRVYKLCEHSYGSYSVPYISYCMPAVGAAFTGEGQSAGVSKCKKKKKKRKKRKLNF